MADVAARAGVSTSTVSRALKDHPRISKATCLRIQKIAKELGYQPSPLVRALMESRRGSKEREICTLAFITDDCGQEDWEKKPTCGQTFQGVVARAKELGYRIDVLSTREFNLERNQLEKVLVARGIPGAIFGFSQAKMPAFPIDLSNLAVVGLASYFSSLSLDRVKTHSFQNVELGLRKLRERGFGKIGLVVPAYNNELVGGGWTAAALEDARNLPEHMCCPPLVIEESRCTAKRFFSWFDKYQPDALLVYKVPVLSFLKLRLLRVGKDIGVAWIFRKIQKSSAGVDADYEEAGAALVDLLVSKLQANDLGLRQRNRHLLIDGYWIDGPSADKQG